MLKFAKSGLAAILVIPFVISSTATGDDPPEVAQIAQTAANAQNAGDYEVAAEKWEELISDYPNSTQIGIAYYHSGFCHVQTGNYAKAADRLKSSISKLDPAASVSLAQAHLFLGFSQAKLGRELLQESPQEARQWLTTATQTFVALLNRFPKFEDADQALFFQADAFEALQRMDDAANSYAKMLEFENAEFKLDGLFALAFIRSQQGKYDEAYRLYTQFIQQGSDHSAFNEVKFRAAESLTELAKAAENIGDAERANELNTQAANQFEDVFKSRDSVWADDAKFEQANLLHKLGKFGESSKAYETVVGMPGSEFADRARVYAGRDYLRAGDANSASQILEKAVAVPSSYAPEAAHWLAQLYLRSDQNEQAFLLSNEWIDKTQDVVVKVPLLMDRADAAYADANRRSESLALYLEVADQFPKHRLAATAMYNAAYAAMELGKFEVATKITSRFRSDYSESDYLPDVLEVEADSYLLASDPKRADNSLADLLAQFAGHPKKPLWQLRRGLALYLQKQYEATIDLLDPVVATLDAADKKAEALHWIGSSQYQLGKPVEAIQSLQNSFATDKSWRRADETLLTLSRSFYLNKKPENAKQVTEQLIREFPKSPLIGEASYRLGEFEYDSGNYQLAISSYRSVVDNFRDSQFAPYAMYGIAWSQLQLAKFSDAVNSFTDLINKFPQHSLATEVLVGRASAYRQDRQLDKAIADAQRYLASDTNPAKKEEAMYELGLAQIGKQEWNSVIKTFNDILTFASKSNLADRYHYELAWAYKSSKDKESAAKHFSAIAEQWPTSPLAAESNFHRAQSAYEDQQFDVAAKFFQLCIDRCKNKNILEKATYKLAWSQYKQKDFENALSTFRRQLKDFPDGPLHADARFMVSESLYEADQFGEALKEYKVAKPIVETSKTVSSSFKILTYLHGAQSANLAKEYDEALEFAKALVAPEAGFEVDTNTRRDASMEMGDAYRALGKYDEAVAAYTEASKHPGKTGARSMSMIGEVYLDQKQFAQAINKFKLVWYGYGGNAASDDVKKWQAFAAYEAARCNLLLASGSKTDPKMMNKYISEARKHFEYLINNFPDDQLAPQAKNQLQKLN